MAFGLARRFSLHAQKAMDELRRIRDSLETGLSNTDTAVKDVVADAARDTLKAVDQLDSDIADDAADLVRIARRSGASHR